MYYAVTAVTRANGLDRLIFSVYRGSAVDT